MIAPLVLSLISALAINVNAHWWFNPILAQLAGILYLITMVWLASDLITFTTRKFEQIIWGGLLVLASLSAAASVIFYLYKFDNLVFTFFTFLIPIVLFSLRSFKRGQAAQVKSASKEVIFSTFFILAAMGLFYYLLLNQIDIAVRSPWQMLGLVPLILFGFMAAGYVVATSSERGLWWLILLSFASWGMLLFVFPLAYGFDPWIHQASEKLIATTGILSPKPLYYLGLYMPVVFLEKLLQLPVEIIDRWLVPILAAFGWSAAFILFIRNIKPQVTRTLLVAAGALAFGWSMFTVATPQSLASLWALITILLLASSVFNDKISWWPVILTSLASLLTHPLTGLPLIMLIAMFWLYEQNSRWLKNLSWLAGLSALIITPLAFVVFSLVKISGASVIIKNNLWPALTSIGQNIWASLPMTGQYIDIFDWVYLWQHLLIWLWLSLGFWGLVKIWKHYPKLRLFGLSFTLMSLSFLIMNAFLYFPNLPSNEQFFYTDRLWDLAKLWLWPLVVLGLADLFNSWWQKGAAIKNIILAGVVVSLVAAFYLNYPRLDLYHKDTGYNTTRADIEAVNLIAQDAGDTPYVVLANQAVAAAALHEFGFAHYYSGELYYPLPTGTNPLYPIFLQAAQTGIPTREVISQAHNFSGTPLVYLVLNEYWADFDKLTEVAQTESSAQLEVNNGYIKIYRYDF